MPGYRYSHPDPDPLRPHPWDDSRIPVPLGAQRPPDWVRDLAHDRVSPHDFPFDGDGRHAYYDAQTRTAHELEETLRHRQAGSGDGQREKVQQGRTAFLLLLS
jgi:hypothetical protein